MSNKESKMLSLGFFSCPWFLFSLLQFSYRGARAQQIVPAFLPVNSCFETSVDPGCTDGLCLNAVCDSNPGCCQDRYTESCVNFARQVGILCPPPEAEQSCFETSTVGGCNHLGCQEAVCEQKPSCCNQDIVGEWKSSCVTLVWSSCLPRATNPCTETSAFGGCEDRQCQNTVCQFRTDCCSSDNQLGEWSEICVKTAVELCDLGNRTVGIPENTCFERADDPGCTDPECQEFVCSIDDFCCKRDWDLDCIQIAMDNLDKCPNDFPTQANSCFEPEPFQRSNCSNPDCNKIVCAQREQCCLGPYDEACAEVALDNCEVPKPANTCFETSILPGCMETKCLEKVCEQKSECCTRPYDDACINIARANALLCSPPEPTNSCFETSTFGGCTDIRCAAMVCELSPSCCNREKVGQWTQVCARFAESLCVPEVYPRPKGVCPFGFTCDEDSMANCTELRLAYRDTFEIGDLWAGAYCGNIGNGIENCPQGWYCPTPESKFKCPAGFFCPYKTAEPAIVCYQCEEGATQLVRDRFGYVVLTILAVVTSVTIIFGLFKRYNQALIDRIMAFERRFVLDRLHSFEARHSRILQFIDQKNTKKYGDRLKPKLELISRRLGNFEAKKSTSESSIGEGSSSGISLNENSANKFDARRVFDALDADLSGDVSFSELNVILGLNELELAEFARRMNELGGVPPDRESVARPVFVRYFLQVLKECSNLTVSPEEAEELFDELALNGELPADEVHMSRFYTSSMSDFLSDIQICELIQKFKTVKANTSEGSYKNSTRIAFLPKSSVLKRRRPSAAFQSPSTLSIGSGQSATPTGDSRMVLSRAEFIEFYPQLLLEVTLNNDVFACFTNEPSYPGVDISFKGLTLEVQVGSKSLKVVDGATGRIKARTMTAVMGGSGTGKTSLLNALCGRAFYGEVKGSVYVNGHETTIDEHKDAVGFVPQDDIIYPELSVRENLIYSGRFRLPKDTPEVLIEELADTTLANLGLSRVAQSLVGDVRRRGVSGGERKRVNIGLELMANPSLLFLDEPTSGLDATSALLVMKSLKQLVERQGVTVVAVIHQPRKFIYDLFDSLILLGRGGRIVYHGLTREAAEYFKDLGYKLPEGESIADYLIDVSSGRLEPESDIAAHKDQETNGPEEERFGPEGAPGIDAEDLEAPPIPSPAPSNRATSLEAISSGRELAIPLPHYATQDDADSVRQTSGGSSSLVDAPPLPRRSWIGNRRQSTTGTVRSRPTCVICDSQAIGKTGVTTGKVVQALAEAKDRSAWLAECWACHFDFLSKQEMKELYAPPEPYQLPAPVKKPSFFEQLYHQLNRAFLVAWRNRFEKLIDLSIIVVAVIIISALDGVTEVTIDEDPDIPFEIMVRPLQDDLETLFTQLFNFALTRQIQYPLKVGIILCVFLGLAGMKVVTSKRLEFFREAGSGYNLNAYFAAINVLATIEHSAQVVISAFFSFWIRSPLAAGGSFYVHFLMLAWVCISWALLIPMVFPLENVTLVGGFFFMFSGLMFSGAFPPIIYKDIYDNTFVELFSGWIAPTRFFYEAIAVGEYRCLPEQAGYTIAPDAVNRYTNSSVLALIGYAQRDPTATVETCDGWYWSVPIAFLVGLSVRVLALGAMHSFNRAQQTKKPLTKLMRSDRRVLRGVFLYMFVLFGLLGLTSWLMTRTVPFDEPTLDRTQILSDLLFDD